MKHLLPIFLLLVAVQAFGQEPRDSAFWDVEMEDSVSALAIKPVKKPKKLLNSIIDQLLLDLEKKPQVKNYMCEFVNVERISVPWTIRQTLSAQAGIRLETINTGEFRYEGPYKLTSKDSSFLSLLIDLSRYSPILENIDEISIDGEMSKSAIFKKLMRTYYDVTVYSITDNSGRGVYRVSFSPKKKEITQDNWKYYIMTIAGTAYFDIHTLHLTRIKGEVCYPRNTYHWEAIPMDKLSFQSSPYVSIFDTRERYQIDYDNFGETPVVRLIRYIRMNRNKVMSKTTIQEILKRDSLIT